MQLMEYRIKGEKNNGLLGCALAQTIVSCGLPTSQELCEGRHRGLSLCFPRGCGIDLCQHKVTECFWFMDVRDSEAFRVFPVCSLGHLEERG